MALALVCSTAAVLNKDEQGEDEEEEGKRREASARGASHKAVRDVRSNTDAGEPHGEVCDSETGKGVVDKEWEAVWYDGTVGLPVRKTVSF